MDDTGFEYGEIAPAPHLSEHVRSLWFLRSRGAAESPQLVVPDGCMELVLNCGAVVHQHVLGRVEVQPRAMLMGEVRRPVLIQPAGAVDMIGVRFVPGAARLFFDPPMEELVDGMTPLDCVMRARDRALVARIFDADDRHERLRHLQGWLTDRLLASTRSDEIVRECIFAILGTRGAIGTDQLARRTGFTVRQVERRFKSSVGISPKSFGMVTRFRAVLGAVAAGAPDWIDVALDCGYYDQAHLIRDFHAFTGRAPRAYFADAHPLNEAFSTGWNELSRRAEVLGRIRIDRATG